MSKVQPYKLTVTVTSVGPDDVLNQELVLDEYSQTAEVHVMKNFAVADAVTLAVANTMKGLATDAGLYGKKPSK